MTTTTTRPWMRAHQEIPQCARRDRVTGTEEIRAKIMVTLQLTFATSVGLNLVFTTFETLLEWKTSLSILISGPSVVLHIFITCSFVPPGIDSESEPESRVVGDVSECACPTLSGVFPHPSSCAHMCRCISGQPRVLECPKGQHFHSQVKVCVRKRLADCDTRTKSNAKNRSSKRKSRKSNKNDAEKSK